MKKQILSVFFLFFIAIFHGFTQEGGVFNYQTVVRDTSGIPITGKNISFRVSILNNHHDSLVVYQEVHQNQTSQEGFVNLFIGNGSEVKGSFGEIPWAGSSLKLQIEMDPDGGSDFIFMGSGELLSIPYALHATKADTSLYAKRSLDFTSVLWMDDVPCNEFNEGSLRYDHVNQEVVFCNGAKWLSMTMDSSQVELPVLETMEVGQITTHSAISGGVIIHSGSSQVLAQGVCWNDTGMPDVNSSKDIQLAGVDTFTSVLGHLGSNRMYYARAFATSSHGTGYGDEQNFTTLPRVSTDDAFVISGNSFIGGGTIEHGGEAEIISRGIVYASHSNPTLEDSALESGQGFGHFTVIVGGLPPDTGYYRTYAENAGGINYGPVKPYWFYLTGGGLTDHHGRDYKTVIIGEQEWMAENMAYLPTVFPPDSFSHTSPRYYVPHYHGNSLEEAMESPYYQFRGVLYNYEAAMHVCPEGWRIPTKKDWENLENYLIANGFNFDRSTHQNKIAKSLSASFGWPEHVNTGSPGNDLSLNNRSGFSVVPAGFFNPYPHPSYETPFLGTYTVTLFWSSSPDPVYPEKFFALSFGHNQFGSKVHSFMYRHFATSVRCLKN